MTEYWYRYDDLRVASVFDMDTLTETRTEVRARKIPVHHHTPKGVQLNDYGHMRFVLKDARKRYACPTEEEAMVSFLARKKRQRKIIKSQLTHVEAAIKMAEDGLATPALDPGPFEWRIT